MEPIWLGLYVLTIGLWIAIILDTRSWRNMVIRRQDRMIRDLMDESIDMANIHHKFVFKLQVQYIKAIENLLKIEAEK